MTKPTKYVLPEQTLQEHNLGIWEAYPFTYRRVKWHLFPKGDTNNCNEIEF